MSAVPLTRGAGAHLPALRVAIGAVALRSKVKRIIWPPTKSTPRLSPRVKVRVSEAAINRTETT